MVLYYAIFLISYVLCVFDFVESRLGKLCVYLVFCTFITLIVGFREVGIDNDSEAYQDMFDFYRTSTFMQIIEGGYGYVEKGYVFLNKIISLVGGNHRILFLVMAIFTALFNYIFFWKKSSYVFLSILFYISFFYLYRDFTQIRYGLCAAICMWAISLFLSKKYFQSLFTILVAISFHNSAFILLLAVLIIRIFKNQIWYVLIPIPCYFIGKLLTLQLVFSLLGYNADHMNIYLKDESAGSASISMVGYCICLLYFFLINYRSKHLHLDPIILKTGNFYYKLVSIAVAMNFLFINISIFQRFSFIMFQFCSILIAMTIELMANRIRERYLFVLYYFLIASFLLFYGIRMINEDLVRPYIFSYL